MYNYLEAVKKDVEAYLKEEVDLSKYTCLGDLEDKLNEVLWCADSVTGNGSGSYTFNRHEAEENLLHNLGLLFEALSEFGDENPYDFWEKNGAEGCDVTIRCYLLPQAIAEVLAENEKDIEEKLGV